MRPRAIVPGSAVRRNRRKLFKERTAEVERAGQPQTALQPTILQVSSGRLRGGCSDPREARLCVPYVFLTPKSVARQNGQSGGGGALPTLGQSGSPLRVQHRP
jgi:hypothetical protein